MKNRVSGGEGLTNKLPGHLGANFLPFGVPVLDSIFLEVGGILLL